MVCEDFPQFAWFHMAAGPQFGIQQLAVGAEFELPAVGGDQGKSFDLAFQIFIAQNLGHRTDGPFGVVSGRAVNQLKFYQHCSRLLGL